GYRSYFALRDVAHAPDGTSVGAVVGYLDMVARLVVSRRPDEVIHVYDHDWRPTVRTQLYPGYKANRPDEPADLTVQFALLRRVLDLTGMRQAQAPTWEAEDAIGALVVGANDDDLFEMVSGDRDLIQLVRDPSVRLLFTVRGVSELLEFDEVTVMDKYGVPASRYAEFAILRGDPSDELPGVKGVGEKTALALIQTYASIDELLADAAGDAPRPGPLKGKPALRARLRESEDYLAAMRKLVPIEVTCPVEVWHGARDDDALRALAEEYGLRGSVVRLLAAMDSTGST
ncbi:MAG: 5'-3' exonuclease H3TH domain-containing protein, partial [Actinomycetota bacterium]